MSRATLLPKIFDSLAGTWTLRRCLVSANASEPSGTCTGTALFTPRSPSPVVNTDGKLDLADNEMLYHEQGTFELPSGVEMPFTKKYIWRLQKQINRSNLSVWFCKPGTEIIDYLFHAIDIDTESEMTGEVIRDPALIELGGNGGHLCIDDFYSTTYTFRLDSSHHTASSEERFHKLHSFSTVHEVRGPRKDQVIIHAGGSQRGQLSGLVRDGESRTKIDKSLSHTIIVVGERSKKKVPERKARYLSTTLSAAKGDVMLPEPFARIPRHELTFGPSPIHALPRISAALGEVAIYAKREDCNSAIAYGGNKTRKLEYLVPEALDQGCDTLVSIGGYQSNHTRQVAGVAAKLGLRAKLVQEKWVPHEDVGNDKVGNIQLSRLMSADVRLDSAGFGIEHKDTLKKLQQEVESQGGKPYYIPAGASDHPLGGLGFARWAFEVRQQELQMDVFFDIVIVCAVTGSTFAGMIAGFKLLEKSGKSPSRRVIGIDASAKPKETFDQVLRISKRTAAKIGLSEQDIKAEDVILDDRYHAGCYGIADEPTLDAIRFGASTEAFITDPVYEGKSLAGLMDMIRKGDIKAGSTVLYAHLGGQLALNAYSDIQ